MKEFSNKLHHAFSSVSYGHILASMERLLGMQQPQEELRVLVMPVVRCDRGGVEIGLCMRRRQTIFGNSGIPLDLIASPAEAAIGIFRVSPEKRAAVGVRGGE
ncbi:hypothetical protein JHK82_041134 [Glycine max]|nr:hypothetical protein JHK86_041201 [Glycine max]KAG4955428.1 hypothetical protein JHK85_041808 [Glycine max]KAG5104164.1 hypothetical protein JHK82_041134 [Glycine max]KAG5115294.1 hypothetical protein JHK84_041407 [Glycine max]